MTHLISALGLYRKCLGSECASSEGRYNSKKTFWSSVTVCPSVPRYGGVLKTKLRNYHVIVEEYYSCLTYLNAMAYWWWTSPSVK